MLDSTGRIARASAGAVAVMIGMLWAGGSARAQLVELGDAAQAFAQNCSGCHGKAGVVAPDVAKLRELTPESVYAALKDGAMRVQARDLSDETKRAIATYLGGRAPGRPDAAEARRMPNLCKRAAPFRVSGETDWNGWGVDDTNARFQRARAAGLTANQVPALKLAWAFGFPGTSVVYGQPTVAGGRVFIGVDSGYVYAIDSRTGCVHWSYAARAGVRSAVSVGRLGKGLTARYAAYFGDIRGRVYAVDAATGKLLWSTVADEHPTARISGAPKLHQGRLYVPVSSMEEGLGGSALYPCCSFRGSVVALDARTGHQIWKTYTITEPLTSGRRNSFGTQLLGPSGAAIWNSPTLDAQGRALYVGTGDAYSLPVARTTDAIMALDSSDGHVLWSVQDTPNDAWLASCRPPQPSENCPGPLGPDYDFGASPILHALPDGHRLLIAGQKSGIVWAHDPDAQGALRWKVDLAPTPPVESGEIVWGGAADDDTVYFGLNSGGVAALRISDGSRKWLTALDPTPARAEHRGQSGPVTVIPGVVFSGGWDGVIRALASDDGRLLWQFDTMVNFDTVNAVTAKGGSLGAAGPTVAGGMLFVPSGYIGVQNGVPGNVLLAFSPGR
jgi:polyvinyl alcohol dehydrogenase (cytochrome)